MARPHAVTVTLSNTQLQFVQKRLRAHTLAKRLHLRYSIVLLAHQHWTNQAIADHLGCHEETVRQWRNRFAEHGLDGLHDLPRSGRPRSVSPSGPVPDHRLGV